MKSLIPIDALERRIYFIREHKVMLDLDLAKVYGVSTKRLNQQVHRNLRRFPSDFMFQLTTDEVKSLRSQFATSKMAALRLQNATLDKQGRGRHRKYLPYAFTEHGAVMVSAVLKTSIAIEASIRIARAFNKLRELLATHKDLAKKVEALEKKYDARFSVVSRALRQLMDKPARDNLIRIKGFSKE